MHRYLVASFFLLAVNFTANISAHADADCNLLLAEGVRDYSDKFASYAYYNKFKSFLRDSQAKTLADAKAQSQNIGLGYEGFELQFGSADSSTHYEQWKSDFLNSQYSMVTESRNNSEKLRTVSATLVEGFNKCKKMELQNGGWMFVAKIVDETTFIVEWLFQRPRGDDMGIADRIVEFKPENAHCDANPEGRYRSPGNATCKKIKKDKKSVVRMTTSRYTPHPIVIDVSDPKTSVSPKFRLSVIYYAEGSRLERRDFASEQDIRALGPPETGKMQEGKPWETNIVTSLAPDYVLDELPNSSTGQKNNPGSITVIVRTDHYDWQRCVSSVTSSKQTGIEVNVVVTSKCTPRIMGGLWGRYTGTLTLHALRNVTQTSPVKRHEFSDQAFVSWLVPFEGNLDASMSWRYVYDVTITGADGKSFRLCRRSDGQERNQDGEFGSFLDDKNNLRIVRGSMGFKTPSNVQCDADSTLKLQRAASQ